MDYLILVLIFCIVVGTTLKLSFWPYKWIVILSICASLFVLFSLSYVVEQSKTSLQAYFQNPAIVQDMAVLITIEAIIYILYCFNSLKRIYHSSAGKSKRVLNLYPGLLLFPVLYYVQASLIFSYPGVSFENLSYALAFVVLLGLPLLSKLFHYLCPANEQRLEITFLVSLLVGILGLLSTIDSTIIYAQKQESEFDVEALIAVTIVFLGLIALGYGLNRLKWNIKHKRYK